jgi:AcrR family transcriptional regulator
VSSAPKPVDQRIARGDATRQQILGAAREILRERGYAATTMRAVSDEAGVQVSLVHYHFGGKRQLLSAVLEYENARLLARQEALFAGPDSLADKWRGACGYLREDLRSGYVRILWELWAAGLSDDELARRWRDAIAGWRQLIERVATEWQEASGADLPLAPGAVATLVSNLFLGAEAEMLAGVTEEEAPHLAALEACADLIDRFERG